MLQLTAEHLAKAALIRPSDGLSSLPCVENGKPGGPRINNLERVAFADVQIVTTFSSSSWTLGDHLVPLMAESDGNVALRSEAHKLGQAPPDLSDKEREHITCRQLVRAIMTHRLGD